MIQPKIPDAFVKAFAQSFRHIPTNLISRSWGRFARTQRSRHVIRPFAKAFHIAVGEAEKDLDEYGSLNEFFTRKLKPNLRSFDTDPKSILSPVDGTVSSSGACDRNQMMQVKGSPFDIYGLLRDGPMARRFESGQYSVLYLSPQDYHRVHAPLDLQIHGLGYMPGTLLPVNRPSVRFIPELYTQNERVMIYADSACGPVSVVLVGAQCVGYISLTFSDLVTNRFGTGPQRLNFKDPIAVKKGMELGAFEMGSTVVLLFAKDRVALNLPAAGLPVRVGQNIGTIERT